MFGQRRLVIKTDRYVDEGEAATIVGEYLAASPHIDIERVVGIALHSHHRLFGVGRVPAPHFICEDCCGAVVLSKVVGPVSGVPYGPIWWCFLSLI